MKVFCNFLGFMNKDIWLFSELKQYLENSTSAWASLFIHQEFQVYNKVHIVNIGSLELQNLMTSSKGLVQIISGHSISEKVFL